MEAKARETLITWLKSANRIVFFGGAGVSTESGIPDFRSTDGLYNQAYDYPPETILSHDFFLKRPEVFFRFYREKILISNVRPNAAHIRLAEWEQMGKLSAIVTQNIDGLHQMAGSKRVYELHGSILRNHCMRCHRAWPMEAVRDGDAVPKCTCGGAIKPDVVLYGEGLEENVVEGAVEAIAGADLLIVGGTSLNVYPAAGLINVYRGQHTVLINKSATPMDATASLVLRDPIGQVLGSIHSEEIA